MSFPIVAITVVGLAAVAVLLLLSALQSQLNLKKKLPLPPGPRPLPLIGNLKDLPAPGVPEALHWAKHRDLYGMFFSKGTLHTTGLTYL